MNAENQAEDICCPKFDPALWDGVEHYWTDKLFVKDKVNTFLHMPLNFSAAMVRLNKALEGAGASSPEWLCLSDHRSSWAMDVYLAVDREIPGAQNVKLSGKLLSKVYEGSYNKTGSWVKDFEKSAQEKGVKMEKKYFWYTTCPKCAKKYGKNYVVILGQLA